MSTTQSAFISHSSPDDRYVVEFVQMVRGLGFTEVFNDSHTIEPDEEFWPRIERGILECAAFVVILSEASVKSHWVDREVEFARKNGKRVIPVRIDDCKVPASFDGRDVIELKNGGRRPVQRLSPPRFLHHSAEFFLGREKELQMLDEAWANGTNVLSLIAWGGVGKTALVSEWVQTRFIDKGWKGEHGEPCPLAYFDWSFYDQGTRGLDSDKVARTGSVGSFFEEALIFFGDPDPNRPGKGARLAELVRRQRTLLILDGLEPLQQPPGHPQAGRLTDPDLRDLLAGLAQKNLGLCLVTSREGLKDLSGLIRAIHAQQDLEDLPVGAAVRLLRQFQINGTDHELEEAARTFSCHALSLTLVGRYLLDAHGGNIARIDHIRDLKRVDAITRPERHRTVWRILESYETWLSREQINGNTHTLAVLRLSGLFDRIATADCFAVLLSQPVIPGLTDALCGISHDEWNILLKRLEYSHLVKLRASSNQTWDVDVHPLIREYFSQQLRQAQPQGYRAGHSRLFDHLFWNTEYRPDTLEGLQPLYQTISHGCFAGRYQEACVLVYRDRILRGVGRDGFFSWKILGAVSSDLAALGGFFDQLWTRVTPKLDELNRAWILGECANRLRHLNRLGEATEAMRTAADIYIRSDHSLNAAIHLSNLSELLVLSGNLPEAIAQGIKSLQYAVASGDTFECLDERTVVATALFQKGENDASLVLFEEAERIQREMQSQIPLLYSLPGFRLSELLTAEAEFTAWQLIGNQENFRPQNPLVELKVSISDTGKFSFLLQRQTRCIFACMAVEMRSHAARRFWKDFASHKQPLLDAGHDHLALGRATHLRLLIGWKSQGTDNQDIEVELRNALKHYHDANAIHYMPKALLAAAFYQGTSGGNPTEAKRLLDEAQDIAERGPMPLYLADVHLHRARLFRDRGELVKARELIERCGYWRRREELEDAEAVAGSWK